MSLELAAMILASGLAMCGGLGWSVMLVWMPERRTRQRWLIASGVALAGWAYAALARHIPDLTPASAERTTYLLLSGLTLAPVMYYAFVRRMQPPADVYARALVIWTPLFVTGFLLLIWTGNVADVPAGQDRGFDLTVLGLIGLAHVAIYALIPFLLLRVESRIVYADWFGGAGLAFALAVGANLVPGLRGTPLDVALLAIASGLIGYAVVRGEMFAPLLAANQQLEAKRNELRATVTDLGAEKAEADQLVDELRRANRAKNEFLTNMSHALRTPLNSIVGYSELLLQGIYGDINERQTDRIDKIHRNSQQLLALLNDILVLSRIEGGRLELNLAPVRVANLIAAEQAALAERLTANGLTFEVNLTQPLRLIRADEARIQQIIHALLTHALEQAPTGHVQFSAKNVTVHNGRTTDAALPAVGWLEDRHWLLISVSEDGPGIPPEEQALLFEAFRQAGDPARQEKGIGSGLGLVVAKRLAELHAGRIWLRSELGRGSTLFVALPAQDSFDTE